MKSNLFKKSFTPIALCLTSWIAAPSFAQTAPEAAPASPVATAPVAAAPVAAGAAAPIDPIAAVSQGSIQIGFGHSTLTNNTSPDWQDTFVRGNHQLAHQAGVINWELAQQEHFGETGQVIAIGFTKELGDRWIAMASASKGLEASFIPHTRVDAGISYKWLDSKQLVTSLQYTQSKSGDQRYQDKAWQASASYYFSAPLVAEVGMRRNVSNPGDVVADRYYSAVTYGTNKKYYLTAKYEKGREGYLPLGAGMSEVDFKSDIWTLGWRQWFSKDWGFDLTTEHYKNEYYKRNGLNISIFKDY